MLTPFPENWLASRCCFHTWYLHIWSRLALQHKWLSQYTPVLKKKKLYTMKCFVQGSSLTLCWCTAGSCRQSRPCCRSRFIRSPRWTSVCLWRTRSCCGSSIMETWVAHARCLPPPPLPPTPSTSNHLAALAASPALPCHPDNNGSCFQEAEHCIWVIPLDLRAIFVSFAFSKTSAWPWLIQNEMNSDTAEIQEKQHCTEALNKEGHDVCL